MNKERIKNFLEQLPRVCSPTICGTLSCNMPDDSGVAKPFEWSLEQKALLSPANITTDEVDHHDVCELRTAWQNQDSEMFFSQKTIAPSPSTPVPKGRRRPFMRQLARINDNGEEEDDDDDLYGNLLDDMEDDDDGNLADNQQQQQPLKDDDNDKTQDDEGGREVDHEVDQNDTNLQDDFEDDVYDDDFAYACSSQSQKMDVFSPNSFSRVMEDDKTLQSTPKLPRRTSRASQEMK